MARQNVAMIHSGGLATLPPQLYQYRKLITTIITNYNTDTRTAHY